MLKDNRNPAAHVGGSSGGSGGMPIKAK